MKGANASSDGSDLSCRPLNVAEARTFPRIPSGYETDRTFRVERRGGSAVVEWSLHEELLARPLVKQYDDGDVDELLDSYRESGPPDSMRIVGAFHGTDLIGLATWARWSWNNTMWLADIRVARAWRRTGAGSQLITYLKREAAAMGLRGIRVETQVSNFPAIQFYRKHGFEPCGLDDHLYSNRDLERRDVALFLFWERGGLLGRLTRS